MNSLKDSPIGLVLLSFPILFLFSLIVELARKYNEKFQFESKTILISQDRIKKSPTSYARREFVIDPPQNSPA